MWFCFVCVVLLPCCVYVVVRVLCFLCFVWCVVVLLFAYMFIYTVCVCFTQLVCLVFCACYCCCYVVCDGLFVCFVGVCQRVLIVVCVKSVCVACCVAGFANMCIYTHISMFTAVVLCVLLLICFAVVVSVSMVCSPNLFFFCFVFCVVAWFVCVWLV